GYDIFGAFNVSIIKSNIWSTNSPLKLETKATFDVNSFPIIGEGGKIELSDHEQLHNELNETFITTSRKKVIQKVVVPPKTKVVVGLITTKGKCDVPFTFKQSNTLNNGNTFTTEMEGNIYTVSNYYNIEFEKIMWP
ncbi:hypothetical protein Goshw_017098, partial [Gossypium schwendimanii]|nr:hypothetical protein [Gossypium schwendimanii]